MTATMLAVTGLPKTIRAYLRKLSKKGAPLGGHARWEGTTKEQRSQMMKEVRKVRTERQRKARREKGTRAEK